MIMSSRQNKPRCKPQNPYKSLRKVVDLMEHPISSVVTSERQVEILNEFISVINYAFWLHDIPYIIRLYEAIMKKLDTNHKMMLIHERLLNYSTIPPIMTKASDQVTYARDLQQYFSILGYSIIYLKEEHLCAMALNAIISLLERQKAVGFCCVPLQNLKNAASESKLGEIVAQLFEVIHINLFPRLLHLAILLADLSPHVARKMVAQDSIEYLLQALEPKWRERDFDTRPQIPTPESVIPNLQDITLLLWILLNSISKGDEVYVQMPSTFALWSLKYAFRWTIISKGQRTNRNNLAGLILKLLTVFPKLCSDECALVDDIAILSVSTEYDPECGSKRVEFKPDEMDFLLRKIVLSCLPYFVKSDNVNNVFKSHNVISRIINLLNKNSHSYYAEQHCELMIFILGIIPKLVPIAIDDFLECNGIQEITRIVEAYLEVSFDLKILLAALNCLSKITQIDGVAEAAIAETSKKYDSILCVSFKILKKKPLSQLLQKCLSRTFLILENIHKTGFEPNIDFSLDLCFEYLKNHVISSLPAEDRQVLDIRLTICALHFLWDGLISRFEGLQMHFVKIGGIYLLLDVINVSYCLLNPL